MTYRLKNVLNILVAMALLLVQVNTVHAFQNHPCNESGMMMQITDMQTAGMQTDRSSCKCKQHSSKSCCCDDACKCMISLHAFVAMTIATVRFTKPQPVYNQQVSLMETDLVIFPLLRPPIA